MYKYDQYDQKLVDERVEQYRDQTQRYLAGEISEEQFLPPVRAVFDLLGDDQIYRFGHDMKDQLIGCMDDHYTMSESMSNEAAAIKAGYHSYAAAKVASSFGVTYPENIIRRSGAAKDAVNGGYAFTPAFSSYLKKWMVP